MERKQIQDLMQNYLTVDQSKELAKSEWWKHFTPQEAAYLQLNQSKLCMPFSLFHRFTETLLGKPVLSSQFNSRSYAKLRESAENAKPKTLC